MRLKERAHTRVGSAPAGRFAREAKVELPVTTTTQSRWITIALRVHHLPERLKAGVCLALVVAVWGWVDVRRRGAVDPNDPGLHKTDFTVYTEAGAAFFDGRPPYEVTNPRGWGYLYPPPFAMLVAPLHALRPEAQVLVWFCLLYTSRCV